MRRAKLLSALSTGFLALAFFFAVLRLLYPVHYRETIFPLARQAGLDPYLVLALVRQESRFDPRALSLSGARGLMQLMPATADWVARKMGYQALQPEDLYRPGINLALGIWYLAYLRERFGSVIPALAAYNAGEERVRTWMREGRWDGSYARIHALPYEETRRFLRSVLRDWRVYRLLY